MNLAFTRELEMAEYDAFQGSPEKYFSREERLIAMDIHGDVLSIVQLHKFRLIAALRTDRFVTARDVWAQLKPKLNRKEIRELWSIVWSAPEAKTPTYIETVRAILGSQHKRSSVGIVIAISVVCLIFLVVIGGGGVWYVMHRIPSDPSVEDIEIVLHKPDVTPAQPKVGSKPDTDVQTPRTTEVTAKQVYSTEDLFKIVSPSIVMLIPVFDLKYPDGTVSKHTSGHGSGFAIHGRGLVPNNSSLILTNAHVAERGHMAGHLPFAMELEEDYGIELLDVTLYAIVQGIDGPRLVKANEKYFAPQGSSIDLALLQLDNVELPPLQLESSNPNIGVDVAVIGYRGSSKALNASWNSQEKDRLLQEFAWSDLSKIIEYVSPNKEFLPTLSFGKVSNIFSRPTDDQSKKYDVIEHSAMISGGNSGGPMLNMYNEVIGMLTWSSAEIRDSKGAILKEKDQAINLCIGIEEIQKVIAEWEAKRR